MKDIVLKIVGKQTFSGNLEPDIIEFMTLGRGGSRDGTTYLVYEESEPSGMEQSTTRIKIKGKRIEMQRTGPDGASQTELVFEKGRRTASFYGTPYGAVEMEVLTEEVKCDLSDSLDQGGLYLSYQFSLKGLGEGRNCLDLRIIPREE